MGTAPQQQRPTQGQLRAQQQQLMAAALMRKAEWEEMEIPQSWLPIPLIKVGCHLWMEPSAERVYITAMQLTEATAHVTL